MSLTNWNVSTQISGNPTISMKPFCQPAREAVQMARGSLSNSTARMVAPIGPILKKVTAMPGGKQTSCWYFHPVAKITNSVTVAMASNGSVKYEMRLLFNRCHGENPKSRGAAEWEESCELIELEFFINEPCIIRPMPGATPLERSRDGSVILVLPIDVSIWRFH